MLNLLLVDDDESSTALFQFFLERTGADVHLQIVHSGNQAAEYLAGLGEYEDRARFPLPDLVVLDLIMPGMSGFDVLDWRRGVPRARSIPVVAFSGSLRKEDQEQALAKGADRFFPKPTDVDKLKDTIAQIVEFGKVRATSHS